jgi:hypothetical protein
MAVNSNSAACRSVWKCFLVVLDNGLRKGDIGGGMGVVPWVEGGDLAPVVAVGEGGVVHALADLAFLFCLLLAELRFNFCIYLQIVSHDIRVYFIYIYM